MTATEPAARSAPDWAEIRRLYEERRDLTVGSICERMGVSAVTLRWHARHEGWRRRIKSVHGKAPEPRQALLDRFYKAIDLKLKQLETTMSQEESKSPADAERETRALGTLIRNVEKVTELKDELDRAGTGPQSRHPRLTPEDAERVGRELAKRILAFAAAHRD
jgi:predicted nuclease with TOPRIM domain